MKLEAFEMRCYRKVLNITWKDKIRNEDVLLRISSPKFKPKRILAHITESQLSWFGHVCRMSNMRLPKRILMEMVPGTNRQGRPRKRWKTFAYRAENICLQSSLFFPNAFLWKWSLVPTDREDQGRDGKMISLLAAPMLKIGIDGLILFMEPTSFGTRCKDRQTVK